MNKDVIVQAYRQAGKRALFLDYDGTLVGFRADPSRARPTARLLHILQALANDAHNTVILISGRDRQTLQAWMGHLPIDLAAEHGFFYKLAGESWQSSEAPNPGWKSIIRSFMEPLTPTNEGAWIEEKAHALAWQSRPMADSARAERLQKQLVGVLTPAAQRLQLRVLNGKRIVDVFPLTFRKGTAARSWLAGHRYDFVLAAGDDVTDEELFKAMPPHSFTFKVGPGQTLARQRLPTPQAMLQLLASLGETHY